jgi:hypothetical protein
VAPISDWLDTGSVRESSPMSHEEMVRRLPLYRDAREGDSPSTQERRPAQGTTPYAPTGRDKPLVTLVPTAAIAVMVILFAVAASPMLMP